MVKLDQEFRSRKNTKNYRTTAVLVVDQWCLLYILMFYCIFKQNMAYFGSKTNCFESFTSLFEIQLVFDQNMPLLIWFIYKNHNTCFLKVKITYYINLFTQKHCTTNIQAILIKIIIAHMFIVYIDVLLYFQAKYGIFWIEDKLFRVVYEFVWDSVSLWSKYATFDLVYI